MKKNKKIGQKFSVDALTLNVAKCIIQDFRSVTGDPSQYSTHYDALIRGEIEGIRSSVPAVDVNSDSPYSVKMDYQVASTLKRYRLEKDLYTDAVLRDEAIAKFLAVQRRLENQDLSSVSKKVQKILHGASIYIRLLLGEYDREEHGSSCRFGKRASVGIPSRYACEAARWELPITGSSEQISWFDSEMSQNCQVQEYWAKQKSSDPNGSTYREVSSLKLTLVPKTFKSFRVIMPNTTIGSYISYGLGALIRRRLKAKGYDISVLQEQHKSYARSASVHGMYTTMDLSSASDTISVDLVRRLFPSDWFEALNQCRIGTVVLPNGQSVESKTFCTMGIGYTFPLQTLVFLALLKSIWAIEHGKCRSLISVYGDDMIFPSSIYKSVCECFEEVGFMVNIDKTYHEGNFRESCGGDYHHGVDVRPFQPQNGQARVGKYTYEAILYKYVNTLLARWSEYEVAGTLSYLMSEIHKVAGKAKVVPGDYPDDSGIKCPTLDHWFFLNQRSDVVKPKPIGHGTYRFPYLRFRAELRKEVRHEPYLWLAIRERDDQPDPYGNRQCSPCHPNVHPNAVRQSLDEMRADLSLVRELVTLGNAPSVLIWVQDGNQSTRCISGRRERRLFAHTTISGLGRYKRQSGTSGFEDRRRLA